MPNPAPVEPPTDFRPGDATATLASPVTIRRLCAADLPELLDLERRCFTGVYAAHRFARAHFVAYERSARACCYVAVVADRVAGYVVATVGSGRAARTMRLDSLAVDVSMRGRGLGSRLLHRTLEEAGRLDCVDVTLEVAEGNRPGRAFFQGRGFHSVRRLPGYYAPRHDGLRMRRSLRRATEG